MKPELSTQELHYLINDHLQKDPRHALQDLMKERWGIGHDLQFPQGSLMNDLVGKDRNIGQKKFKKIFGEYRSFITRGYEGDDDDLDPAGGHGLHSHE